MSMISLGLSGMTAPPAEQMADLVVTNLTGGPGQPGDVMQAALSDGTPIDTYAWGSTPGGNDYGTAASLVVPEAAAGTVLYVSVQAQGQSFATTIDIIESAPPDSLILPGLDLIRIEALAPLPAQPALSLSAGLSLISVEVA